MTACVYLRVHGEDPEHSITSLVTAKTKVTPLKRITIPRLELCAALLLARLATSVRTSLELDLVPIHLWTDSTVTLIWVRSSPSWWKDFIRNRVATIHELVPGAHWHHTPSEDNLADIASRGLSAGILRNCSKWWHGPQWLSGPSTFWLQIATTLDAHLDVEERKQARVTAMVTSSNQEWEVIHRFSTLNKLLRVTAWSFPHSLYFGGLSQKLKSLT